MTKIPRYTLIAPLLAAVLLGGCAKEAPPPAAPPPPAVTVFTVGTERVTLTRTLPGRVSPFLVAEVRPQVTGIILDQLFTEGGQVEAGAALYQIDDAVYRAEYNSAKARLARAEATLELAELNAERTAGLYEANAVSQQEQQNAQSALAQAEADLAVAQAAVVSSEVLLGYTRIQSPISGRVGKSSVTKGALVTTNQEKPLATVQQLDPIYVDVTQSSSELLQLRRALAAGNLENAKLPVTLLLEDGTPYEQEGEVAFSEVTVDPSTGRYLLRVVVPNPEQLLLPGMYLLAEIGLGVRQEAILVPQQAVDRGPSGDTTVMIIGDDNTVQQREVQVSRTVGNQWLVDGGLAHGDRIVLEGFQKIQPGAQVQIAEPETDAPASAN